MLRIRRGTAAHLAAANEVLESGRPCYATDTHVLKIGDGTTPYNSLPTIGSGPSGSLGVAGTGTLGTLGRVTVTDDAVDSGSHIFVTRRTNGTAGVGNIGVISQTTGSFVVESSDPTDNGTFSYLVT